VLLHQNEENFKKIPKPKTKKKNPKQNGVSLGLVVAEDVKAVSAPLIVP